jgi:hypothetical protein
MRYDWFIQDPAGTISRGNNFFVWDNHDEPNAVMDEYATAYLFFQWLRLQSGGGYGIYRTIAHSDDHDQNAVLKAAGQHFEDGQYAADWETLLRTWMAANYINNSSGPFGYRNDSKLRAVRVMTIGGNSLDLYPGEGVYSTIRNGSISPAETGGNNGHIRYGGLRKTGTSDFTDFAGPSYSGDRLLTFNINDDSGGESETGRLTNGPPVPPPSLWDASRQAWLAAKALPMDARDISAGFREEERTRLRRFGKAGIHAGE